MLIIGPVVILFGGGQIPQANFLIGKFIELFLARVKTVVYGIHTSYKGLIEDECYERINAEKAIQIQKEIGTYLSTCRNFDPSSDKYFDLILKKLKRYNIKLIIVTGGDGSARGLNDLSKRLKEANYAVKIIFIPCTIDGLCGTQAIGIKATVSESLRRVKMIAVNAFATFDNGLKGARIAIVEMQGRNRDDILLNTFYELLAEGKIGKFDLSQINIFLIPSSHKWSIIDLLSKVENLDTPTLILVSEGAKPVEGWFEKIQGSYISEKISNMINTDKIRKSNYDVIGYLSQTNDCIDEEQKTEIVDWVNYAINYIVTRVPDPTPYTVAIIKDDQERFKAISLEKLVALNPNSKDSIPLTEEQQEDLSKYLA